MQAKQDELNRASRAKAISDDPIFQEAAQHVEEECWRLFKAVIPEDTESLVQIKTMQYVHVKYQAFFKRVMENGKIVKLELERKTPKPKGY